MCNGLVRGMYLSVVERELSPAVLGCVVLCVCMLDSWATIIPHFTSWHQVSSLYHISFLLFIMSITHLPTPRTILQFYRLSVCDFQTQLLRFQLHVADHGEKARFNGFHPSHSLISKTRQDLCTLLRRFFNTTAPLSKTMGFAYTAVVVVLGWGNWGHMILC